MNIVFEPLNDSYIDQTLELLIDSYQEEKERIPFLPSCETLIDYFKKSLIHLLKNGIGLIALKDGQVVGYLGGYVVENVFGKCKGIYSPLTAHAFKKEYCNFLYQQLYSRVANMWVENKSLIHIITLYSHNKEDIDQWFWMGFGLRCVDAIRQVALINTTKKPSISIKKINKENIALLATIHKTHNAYYRSSPIFMPNEDEDPVMDLTNWLDHENHHLWGAFMNDTAVGYIRIQPNGESIISRDSSIMNITGCYVCENKRGNGIGALLLNEVQKWLLENQYPLCGVDFESINVIGSHFWTQHFTPYTYSLVRRIDERILAFYN